jgi:hypothetical protein
VAPRIDEQSFASERAFDRQCVRVRVAGLVIQTDLACIKEHRPRFAVPSDNSRILEVPSAAPWGEIWLDANGLSA